jgi:hypothetical protein
LNRFFIWDRPDKVTYRKKLGLTKKARPRA